MDSQFESYYAAAGPEKQSERERNGIHLSERFVLNEERNLDQVLGFFPALSHNHTPTTTYELQTSRCLGDALSEMKRDQSCALSKGAILVKDTPKTWNHSSRHSALAITTLDGHTRL